MSSAIDTALSGMAAASRRVEVSAGNIANQQSTATSVNGVTTNKSYIPQDVVQISLGARGRAHGNSLYTKTNRKLL